MRAPNESTLIAALTVSIGVHLVGAAAAALVRPRAPTVRGADPLSAATVDFVVEVPEVQPLPPEDSQPPAEPPPEPEVAAQQTRDEALEPSLPPSTPSDGPTAPDPVGEPNDASAAPQDSAPPDRPPVSLDPRAVALAGLDAAPRVVAPQAQPDPNEEDSRTDGQRAAARLDRFLTEEAQRRPVVTRRGPPDLRRGRDGSLTYQGHAFSARIAPDGTVSFQDGGALQYDSVGGGSNVSVTTRFDLMDGAMRRRGEDPYAAERRWFLRQTREIREGLQDEARAAQRTRGLRRLRARVQRIWETTERTPTARRGRIFRVWDQCSEGDPDGDAGRRAIVQWVRSRLPSGGPDAYTARELATFNGRRQSQQRFAPY